ncbi:MAG: hypothetical protein OEM94_02640 [Acidimicrobiia bacterium]|nr:hypothetical protein [Acidimicrobiia bacterium]
MRYLAPAIATMLVWVAMPAAADTVGAMDPVTAEWHLVRSNGTTTTFEYGNPGDYPFMGDWDCDGIDTPGLYRQSDGFVYLRNANSTGIADINYFFGDPDDIPLAGDFDGDGCDTVSIYRPGEGRFYIIDQLGSQSGGLGAASVDYLFGNVGDQPFAGDFNGDGVDTIGLYREVDSFVYMRYSHSQGIADRSFFYGDPGDVIFSGDWNGDGTDTVGIFRGI